MCAELVNQAPVELDFDPDALRRKYDQERDKRLRDDGNEQYLEVKGQFSHYIEDPYVENAAKRAPLSDEVDVVIIGGGFGGLLAGVRLRQLGIKSIRMIEKAGEFGGTWYWNRYPGAACDIESYVYLPLLEETGYMPPKKYVEGEDILAYSQKIAHQWNLYEDVCFQTEVQELRWNEDSCRWLVRTNQGDEMKARFVISSNGPLNRPKLPGIEGIDSYKGHTFHTSRWDYGYTGGDAKGNLTGLKNKRVGIIGTGATAVQCVPHLGEGAKELFVFQRTPSSIDERNDRSTPADWVESLEPNWHQDRMDNFNTLVSGGIADKDLVNDGWTEIIRNLLVMVQSEGGAELSFEQLMEKMELADFQKMEQIRSRVDKIVKDGDTAEYLKPYYRQFCKRPCFHDDYLPTFNRENVTLVDTGGKGIERISEKGVVANGVEYELDCIIFSTGFEVGTEYSRRCGYETYGKDGLSLSEHWQDGARTLHGLHSHGFPNSFMMGILQTAFTANYPHTLNEQAKNIAYVINRCLGGNHQVVEASKEAEAQWVETIVSMARMNEKFLADCTPGYYNNEGKVSDRSQQNVPYGAGPNAFFKLLEEWREKDAFDGLNVS
ncbi:MAG: NAD(P)/FAD-dependent oxidoreductase [Gammaproteobacteria bacterium]|nr:NAD(P)/FAD-dependent oxidoreductase [Gammaproteobacteria bacterium]